jgi:hypothetical protein
MHPVEFSVRAGRGSFTVEAGVIKLSIHGVIIPEPGNIVSVPVYPGIYDLPGKSRF